MSNLSATSLTLTKALLFSLTEKPLKLHIEASIQLELSHFTLCYQVSEEGDEKKKKKEELRSGSLPANSPIIFSGMSVTFRYRFLAMSVRYIAFSLRNETPMVLGINLQ